MVQLNDREVTRPKIAAALRELEGRHGELTPAVVFDAAKPKSSPLHKFFEWDKSAAWHKHNLAIAGELIRTVSYKRVVTDHGLVVRPPVYVKDPRKGPKQSGYVALRSIAARTPTARAVVVTECRQAASHLRRALAVGATLGLSREIEKMVAQVLNFVERTEKNGKTRKAA